MNKTEINAKLQVIFGCLSLSKHQKELISEVIENIIQTVESSTSLEKLNNVTINAATKTEIGGIKQLPKINHLEENADIDEVITTINTLLSNLEAAGAVANK